MSLDYLFGDDLEGYLLVDLSQIALATAMQVFQSGEKFKVSDVRAMILSTLKHNVVKFKSDGFNHIVICTDNAKKGYWRRQFADYYKRNRAIAREENKNDFDWEGYFDGLITTISELKEFMPYIVLDLDFTEADDCIGVLTPYLVGKGYKVRIVSSDGDFTQLHKYANVDQYSPMQKKFVNVKTGSPQEDCLYKIVKGDKKDCVASIKVKGDFYISNINRNTPQTKDSFITQLVGKTEEEIKEIFIEDINSKYVTIKGGKKWIQNDLELYLEDPEKVADMMKNTDREELMELVHKLRLKEQLVVFYGMDEEKVSNAVDNKSVADLVELVAKVRMKRFAENRVLIDFDYIRDDIKEAIINQFNDYKKVPRGKMYSYFVQKGLTNLLPDINSF